MSISSADPSSSVASQETINNNLILFGELYKQFSAMKAKIDELESRIAELMEEVKAILAQVLAALSSGKPLSSPQIAKLLGDVDAISDQADKINKEIREDVTKLNELAGEIRATASLLQLPVGIEIQPVNTFESEKDMKEMVGEIKHALAMMVASPGAPSEAKLLQMILEANQQSQQVSSNLTPNLGS